jgi:hypothetical protein
MVTVLAVSEYGLQARERSGLQLSHDLLSTHPILHAGRRHNDGYQ